MRRDAFNDNILVAAIHCFQQALLLIGKPEIVGKADYFASDHIQEIAVAQVCVFHRNLKHLPIDGGSIWQCRHLNYLLTYSELAASYDGKRLSLLFYDDKRMR